MTALPNSEISGRMGGQLRDRRARFGWPVSDQTAFYILIAPATLLLLAFYVYPLLQVFWISFTEPQPGFANYAQLLSPSVLRVATTTLRVCLITTFITVVLGYIVAYCWVQAGPHAQRLMLVGILLPLWVSALVRAFAWITLLRREGIINATLMNIGVINNPLPLLWNELGVIIGVVHYMLPYAILPLAANLRGIDPALIAAARGLGATQGQAFRMVYLPLSVPGIVASGILVFIFSLGFYITPALLGGGRTMMVTEYISIQIIEVLRWGLGTTLAVTLVVIIALLLAVVSRVLDLRKLFGAK
ncbi:MULTISPECIES: ABC transporter permease [unclassified Chelatococcus]|jgi:putative spermidine/putrescine transport system permease protein|uniref:ABC transporter permease n=1 Tax=unclassified Chelatococcus TaxID=2638111 RepID=UPI001BCD82CF|nr:MULTISPECIES: ABC transporter permease [unclassified Chelatococcus]CAH1662590.1 ABC transporter permease [Hyphomicrobiales bacterium]MBS7741400.1 ABC transporter permease [Chelatococcus sp. HY11]MBX3546118.1 ABC transporter permease [Chelatococcus sp.]MCO5077233.1 ABC transporter permease [Chelatococcus sp.]CAH1682628.1 ABC transporter permease [Hyphomicrobiales bacterium]